ncbi:MAG: DUF4062 domain-containing protein [Eubacteriales bacterium]
MKKKYQVFISSTYSDLIDERATVSQCLLEMELYSCCGMEQFLCEQHESKWTISK